MTFRLSHKRWLAEERRINYQMRPYKKCLVSLIKNRDLAAIIDYLRRVSKEQKCQELSKYTEKEQKKRQWATTRQDRIDQAIVQKVNSCLNLKKLVKILPPKEWNRFIQIVAGGTLAFSGDPTGFHIDMGFWWLDCASQKTSLLQQYFRKKRRK